MVGATRRLLAGAAAAALLLSASAASAYIDLTTLTLNGGATATSNDLNLGNGQGGEAMSAFAPTPVSSNSNITGSFNFTLVDSGGILANGAQADGIAFVVQNDPAGANALGNGGGDIGADGIQNGVGIGFQSWFNNHATIFQTNSGGGAYGGSGSPGNFLLGGNASNDVSVTFGLYPGILVFSAFNADTSQSVSGSLAFNLTTLGPNLYFGFTGGSGLSWALQDVNNFSLSVTAVPEPSTWAMLLVGFAGLGVAGYRRAKNRLPVVAAA
jgi:hypothetical protein